MVRAVITGGRVTLAGHCPGSGPRSTESTLQTHTPRYSLRYFASISSQWLQRLKAFIGLPARMSTLTRTLKYLFRIGPRQYARQMNAGTLIGTDRFGNKFYENNEEELPLRTKWVDYKEWKEYDASHVEPGWHAWLAYMVDKPPGAEPVLNHEIRAWEKSEHLGNQTFGRGAYKPYSTTKPKLDSWEPVARSRI
ncbi:unnamed protein product [Tuber aestivum]|uniref:NADH dehydrogenase [ubiquinone] 1 alpha subcomplex subunit n=1 Tax=Tuber aestivum TaxID=59557 RepID=A0A292PVT9_9PEZI|nr:unnamed protein product [Tuber aestivum]